MIHENNRVLSRRGARQLTLDEISVVFGASLTQTVCSFIPPNHIDGDISECS